MTDGGTGANESLRQHAGYRVRPWIAYSAAELRNVPRAHLATREAHTVPIYPSGIPPYCLCYYTLINIMAHYRPSNNKE